MKVTISLVQTNSTDDIAANILAVQSLVEQAVKAGAQLIALPENVFYMRPPASDTNGESQEQPQHFIHEKAHPGVRASASWALAHGVWILVGSVAVYDIGAEKSYNRSVLLSPQGEIAATYDKIHLFDVSLPGGEHYSESARFMPGDEAVAANTPFGYIGMSVCYDVRFPHLYRTLAKAGASILAVPSAFTVPTGEAHWHALLRARAIENGCFVIAPAQCGAHPGGRRTYGHSLIVDPWGKVLADGGDQPGIVTETLDLAQVDEVRKRVPSLQHDREITLASAPSAGN